MKHARTAIILGFVVLEILVLIYLLILLYQKLDSGAVKGATSVIRLRRDEYVSMPSETFKHYHEPKADTVLNDHPVWLGYNVSYSINGDTLNERMDYEVSKPPGTFRIVSLGNSFTFGLFVNTYENYSELLEMSLQNQSCSGYEKAEVINLGVPGFDMGYSAERFRLRGVKYQPDMVIWFVMPSTFETWSERVTELEEQYIRDLSPQEIQAHEQAGEYYYPGRLAWKTLVGEMSLEERIVRQAKYFSDFSAYYTGPLVIVAGQWSHWHPYARAVMKQTVLRRPQTYLYTSLPALAEAGGLLADKHPNTKGHQMIASGIEAYLRTNRLLPCIEAAP